MSGAYHSPMPQPPFPTPEVAADPDAPSQMLEGPAGAIEAAVEYPEGAARPVVAVLCHPLPTEGGTMHNKVVTMAARALRKCGATTVRFNFRGVGDSEGAFDDGRGELEDLRTVQPPAVPWLVIQGDADEVVDANEVAAWVEKMPEPPELVRMPEAGHFFHRRLIDLRGAIKHGIRDWLPPEQGANG